MSRSVLWGVRLSPFSLKLEACLQFHQHDYKRLPAQGSLLENSKTLLQLERDKRAGVIERYPEIDPDYDEYPALPFLRTPQGIWQYDSSGIARWLDQQADSKTPHLFPENEPHAFIAHLLDEAFDEFGLYMVHHMRWVDSARSNTMGELLGEEFKHALPPGGAALLAKQFPKRQVRRCPYLFSVAPAHFKVGMSRALTPPSREGFPETHALLNQSWKRYLKAIEAILSKQNFILGERFTIADASIYGQLAMNLVDRETADRMLKLAPVTFNWLHKIQHGEILHGKHVTGQNKNSPLTLSEELFDLLNLVMGTFSALMVQNEQAYEQALTKGETVFNEAAFDAGKALYDGHLMGYKFRTVVKTFQVRVWRELKQHWSQLPDAHREQLAQRLQATELFEHSPKVGD